jgi:hypothetical protein
VVLIVFVAQTATRIGKMLYVIASEVAQPLCAVGDSAIDDARDMSGLTMPLAIGLWLRW